MLTDYSSLLDAIESICQKRIDEQHVRKNIGFYNSIMRKIKSRSSESDSFYQELTFKQYVEDKTLQKNFLIIESIIEKVSAENHLLCGIDSVLEEKLNRHTPLMEKDGITLGLTENSKVILVGSGAIPITGIILCRKFGCKIFCVDFDAEAIELSKKVISRMGLEKYFEYLHDDICKLNFELLNNSNIIITAFIQNKDEIIYRLLRKGHNINLLIRQPRGPYSLIYDKLNLQLINKMEEVQIDEDIQRGHYSSVVGRIR